jgi:hypothetical protein
MAKVLTADVSLSCTVGHGSVQASGAGKLVIAGQPVLTVAGVTGATVAGCAPPGSPPPPPCTAVGSLLSGQAAKLFVSGSPVLLDQCTAKGAPQPHAIGPASASQSKLEAS